jgi:hypothetical protein
MHYGAAVTERAFLRLTGEGTTQLYDRGSGTIHEMERIYI